MDQASINPESVIANRYQLLVEAITDYAIYMLDPAGRVTSWNPGAERFKGYKADEVIGTHFSRFYTAEDREAEVPQSALRQAAETDHFEAEGWRQRKDGSRFWAHVVIDPIRSRTGDLLGFAKITRDLTERMEAHEAFRNNAEQLRLLIEGVTDYAIYMLDRRGHVVNWNTGAEKIKGYRREEIIGEHFSRFYTIEDQQSDAPGFALETAVRDGRFENESLHVRKDGSTFWAHVVIDPICDDDGAVIGFAKVTRDVSERFEQTHKLELARESLFQAQKMEAVGQLTGGVAHDFNNLLAAIIGSLELVRRRTPVDPRVTPLINNALQAAERGAALTERMLTFARKRELKMDAVDLQGLVEGIHDFLRRTIGGQIQIITDFSIALPSVRSDRHQLEAAILNLAVNARDAMVGGGTITITARPELAFVGDAELPAADYVVLSVADTGTGMDAQTLARATEPFFTTKGVGKGTGLGLSMVHGLTAQSGGCVRMMSELHRGTIVELWLPVAENKIAAETASRWADQAPASDPALTVLAVDDDSLVLFITAAMLEDLGHAVITANSGEQALSLLAANPNVDLIVTDEVMPGMTGSQLALKVRALRSDLPVVLATGFAELAPDAEVSNHGFPRLTKPFTQVDLARMISTLTELAQ